MKLPTRQEVIQYFRKQGCAQFVAFCIGIYSTAIVSTFFETRSISNLWGLLAHKTVVEDGTFNILQRTVAVVVGFIVFEIVNRNLMPLLEKLKPVIEQQIAQFAMERGWDVRWAALKAALNTRRAVLLVTLGAAIRSAVNRRFSK